MRSEVLRSIIALCVLFMWMIAGIASVIQRNYVTLEVTTPIMAIVTGYLFGYQIKVNKTRKENGSQ